ncbi:MAG TPA: ABC transporter ATP-binding protein [Firmicutes bacterium]|nr:ABC transporter ATP-binding protein [Bacillota bacterium]
MKDRKKNTIIRIKGLTKRYDTVLAVDNLSLNIREGEIFGLLGPNGAGKTTTTLMLLGLTEPSSGQAFIDGNDCTRNPIEVKKTVGYLPDSVGFYPDLTGRENLIFTGMLNGLDREESGQRAERLLERVGMSYAADRKAGGYSRGMKQRLGIADVLMKDPKVIIMDEPTLGIDPEGMRELIALIRELSVEDGRTILISSHQLYQVQQICDRVGIFVQGRLIACGQIEELGHQLESEGHYELELSAFPADEGLRAVIEGIRGVGGLQEKEEKGNFRVEADRDIRRELTAGLAENGYAILELHQKGGDLDEIYRRYFEKAGEQDEISGGRKKRSIIKGFWRRKEGTPRE